MVQGCREEVDGGRPPSKKLLHSLKTQSPLGTEDLIATAERVRQNIELTGNELGKETNGISLAKQEEFLSDCVQGGRTSAALFPEVSQGGRVVKVQSQNLTPEGRKKTLNHIENCQKFAMVDGKA